jgi:dihydroorotase
MRRTFDFPGFVDVHVHFRDPGMPDAETTESGAASAHRGGFAAVVTMPNTVPAADNAAWIRKQLDMTSLPVKIIPSACITKGRLGREVADLE